MEVAVEMEKISGRSNLEDIDFTSVSQAYFATKYGTLKKRYPLFQNSSHILTENSEKINTKQTPLIQVVIPRSKYNQELEKIEGFINHKKTEFGKHNSFNLRLWM